MWRIGWTPNNTNKWKIGINSAFKVLKENIIIYHNTYQCVKIAYSIQYSNMLYKFVAYKK
jgi:hypothetical protein